MELHHIASRIFNTPLLVHPNKMQAIIYGLQERLGVSAKSPEPGLFTTQSGERKSPGYRVVGQVGVVDVFGPLAHRGGIAADSSYILGYQQMARMLDTAVADNDVRAIVLNFDTPGGEASPVPDLAQRIREIDTQIKPVHACVGCHMHSAGMWLGAAARSISITQMGFAGSVGVYMAHISLARKLEKSGVDVTEIYSGDHKADGSPYKALPEAVRAEFQAEIETMRDMFVAAVAEYRGLSEQHVRDTQARSYMGQAAVDIGFADRVETPDALIARLNQEFSTGAGSTRVFTTETQTEKSIMTEEQTPNPADADQGGQGAASAEQHQAHADDQPTYTAQTQADAVADARKAERDRFEAIMGSDAAVGRTAQAVQLAVKTDMSVEDVSAMLEGMPAAAKSTGGLAAAMASTEQPNLESEDDTQQPSASSTLVQHYNAAKGRKAKEQQA